MRQKFPRKLHRGHFAFMRALAQGLDERASWDRYLRLEGEHTDLRGVRRTITWIRDEFASAARRENRPGMARLILLDADRFDAAPALPTLAEFAEAQGMEDFSEAEQVEAYEAAYPGGPRAGGRRANRPSRRARIVERQLEALRWLELLVAQAPRAGDSVFAWLHPALAQRLALAELPTLVTVVEHVNRHGARWWQYVKGIGKLKALRIIDWLQANEDSLGLHIGLHATVSRRAIAPSALAAVVPAGTAVVPFEKFVVPAALDGSAGALRAPRMKCTLTADTDHEAIGVWLSAKGNANAVSGSSATQRAYRKEAERLLLWAVLERKTAVSSLSCDDMAAFRAFLAAPPVDWCAPRHCQRWSSMWRPFEGPLNPAAQRQCLAVLRSLYAYLLNNGYVNSNPLSSAAAVPPALPVARTHRALDRRQWALLDGLLEPHSATAVQRRLTRAMRWLYATGLRLSEMTQVHCEDLELVECLTDDGKLARGWVLAVTGRGARRRRVPVPSLLVTELSDELERHGFQRQPNAPGNFGIAILARFDMNQKKPTAWSSSGLHKAIKRFVARASESLDGPAAEQVRRASAHWLRHSHGIHALQAEPGRAAVPIDVVQNNMGHAAVATTLAYLAQDPE